MKFRSLQTLLFLFSFFLLLMEARNVMAQTSIDPPDYKNLFDQDSKTAKKLKKTNMQKVLQTDAPAYQDLDFKAPQVQFDKEQNVMKGTGGVIISQTGTQVQADSASVNLQNKQAVLEGNVTLNSASGDISASTSDFNFDSETGLFRDSEVELEEGGFVATASEARKLSETKYSLFDTAFTSCHCKDDVKPWVIKSKEANVTQEGYAHCYDTTVEFHGVPVFYSPYLLFPVKRERASGLLAPTYGYSSRDGVQFKQPIFIVLDDSTDAVVSPFTETHTRWGSAFDYRQAFSRRNKADGRLIYSNERPRDGDPRGTITTGMDDPSIDDDRFLGYYNQTWRTKPDADLPTTFIADLHHTSDDLALREIQDDQIGEYNSQYLTSQVVVRSTLNEYVTASLGGEYNEFIYYDDELGFQRLPEANISALRSFRPFGYNALGAKLVSRAQYTGTEFVRDEGYDGLRNSFNGSLAVPFHYQNYFTSEFGVGVRQNMYNLDETYNPNTKSDLSDASDQTFYNAYYGISTALERVYSLDDGSWVSDLASLGAENQSLKLKRIKNTIEPFVKYAYVPDSNQDNLPFFDDVDRSRQRSIFTYGYTTGLYGRFLPLSGSEQSITELTPKINELPDINSINPLSDVGSLDDYAGLGNVSSRIGGIRQLVTLTQKQTYDYFQDYDNINPGQSPYSGVDSDLSFYPSQNFAFSLQNVYDVEDHQSAYWGVAAHLRDDRGDNIKARYTFNDNVVDQLEGNLELVLTERLRMGYYARYDAIENEFIRSRVALRLGSACNCWNFNVGFGKTINPDKEQVFLSFTFAGLGDIGQQIGTYRDSD